MSRARFVATVTAGATGVLLVAGAGLLAWEPSAGAVGNLVFAVLAGGTSAVLGVLIARRQPRNVVAPLLTGAGLALTVIVDRQLAWAGLAARPSSQPGLTWLVSGLNEAAWWVFGLVALLLLYFPDGRLPGRRWRWVPPALIGCIAVQQVYGAFEPILAPLAHLRSPFGRPPLWLDIASLPAFVLMLVLVLACAVSLAVRFRRADRIGRARIKWLALAGFGIPLYPLVCLAEILLWGHPFLVSQAVLLAGLLGVPVATAIAVLRHDLYDVDKAIAGTVTWALITAVLVGVYGVSVAAAGLLLGNRSVLAAVLATAVCAVALSPLRSRLQRAVDRRFYPLRRAALGAVDTLHGQVAAGTSRPERLQDALRTALRDPALRVGYKVPGVDELVDADGQPVPAGTSDGAGIAGGAGTVDSAGTSEGAGTPPAATGPVVPVELGGTRIGVLVAGAGAASPVLLRQVADRAGTLVEVVRLRLELAGALREVDSSRARLVASGDQERRRLERDLHDGAQQRLVSLGMAIRLAQRHLADGTVDVDGLLDQTVAELGTAVAELRQIAHGLRPSSLDDGLPAALSNLVRGVPVLVEMEVCADPLPDDLLTTAYYVVSEAVTNAVKHADATCIRLGVVRADGLLVVRVADDGRGGATLHRKSGIADRVAALGGRLLVDSPAGHGTVVEAELPCAS